MPTTHTQLDTLSSLLPAPQISLRDGASPIVTPATAADAATVLRFADENGLRVGIAGAGTKSTWSQPAPTDITLSTAALNGVREHVWLDLTATVAAGTPWSHLQAALAVHGQSVALDPVSPETATVGGVVATNDSGALRTRYGSLRDLIIGMTVVLADGTVAKSGGKVVKNVAGYDLHKLMTGAFGTLGLITEVTFRLHPIPKSVATWTVTSPDLAALDRARDAVADSPLPFEALQLRTLHHPGDPSPGFALDIKIAFLAERLTDLEAQLASLVAPLLATPASDPEAPWQRPDSQQRPDAQPRPDSQPRRDSTPTHAAVKITTVPTALASFTNAVAATGGSSVAHQCGTVWATLPAIPDLLLALRRQAEAIPGAGLSVLSWPEAVPGRPPTWGSPGDTLPLLREIRRRFDPNSTLNPGCLLAGL